MWLGTCGLLRAGEFTTKATTVNTLQLRHLTFHAVDNSVLDPFQLGAQVPFYMSLRLDQSKTDPFRRGTTVVVSNQQAITHMLSYIQQRQPLSRMPLFVGHDGQALTTRALVNFTQNILDRANIPNAHLFLGHSFRKGGATSLHEAGHPDSLIKLMGRWASFAFATYIDTPLYMLVEAGRSLGKMNASTDSVATNGSFWDVRNLQ
jgi:integrase